MKLVNDSCYECLTWFGQKINHALQYDSTNGKF